MPHPAKSLRLELLSLEDRSVPSVFGTPWPDAQHVTISFAPDDTDVGGDSSALHGTLGLGMSADEWQTEILRAFQTWAVEANINLSVMPDQGLAFGTSGSAQGDSRHGDIRVGAIDLSDSEIAIASPYEAFSTWSGEVILNSQYTFSRGESADAVDLYTAMLHEAGHVFGLPPGTDADTVIKPYAGVVSNLGVGDVENLRDLYGSRRHDGFDAVTRNDTPDAATAIPLLTDVALAEDLVNRISDRLWESIAYSLRDYIIKGDLTGNGDIDWYRVVVPAETTNVSVQLRTSGVSLLTPRLEVFDAQGGSVGSAVAAGPTDGDLRVNIPDTAAGGVYHVKVSSATGDVFGVGGYRLVASSAGNVETDGSTTEGDGNDTVSLATILTGVNVSTTTGWDYSAKARISHTGDVDYFRVTAPAEVTAGSTMVVTVSSMGAGNLDPTARVFDSAGNVLAARVLSNDASLFTIEVQGITAGARYYVKVAPSTTDGITGYGDYFLGVDFREAAIETATFALDGLNGADLSDSYTLTNPTSRLLHFILSPYSEDASARVRMRVLNADGAVMCELTAAAWQTQTCDVLLKAGTYSVVFENLTPAVAAIAYRLEAVILSDPTGPLPEDPTDDPEEPPPPPEDPGMNEDPPPEEEEEADWFEPEPPSGP